jgi:integrase
MAYAFLSGRSWVARFKGLHQGRGSARVTIRIPVERLAGLRDPAHIKIAADAFAGACEAACRILEGPFTPGDVQNAQTLGAITEGQALSLLGGNLTPGRDAPALLTLHTAALAHPSTQRQPMAERWRYLAYLDDFTAATGIEHVQRITVTGIIDYLKARAIAGDAYDTRRHRLLYLRRATRMGASLAQHPDVLAGFRLDKPAQRAVHDVYSLDELAALCVTLEDAQRWRDLAMIGIMGAAGLRPSECFGATLPDLREDGALTTGTKTAASRRLIPLPPCVARWTRQAIAARYENARVPAIFLTGRNRAFGTQTFAWCIRDLLEEVGHRRLMAKGFRKTFATWTTRAGIDPQHVEAYLGHASALLTAVTAHSYLGEWLVHELRPTAEAIDRLLTAAMARHRAVAAARLATEADPATHPATQVAQVLSIR